MSRQSRTFLQEAGTALAVLAIYVLTLLLPLHQAAGLQRDFNALGFSTLDVWSVCSSIALDKDGAPIDAAALSCPAVGIGKHQLAAVLPPAIHLPQPKLSAPLALPQYDVVLALLPADHVAQSRAPPVAV